MNTHSIEQTTERNNLMSENEKLKGLLLSALNQVDNHLKNEIQRTLGIHPKRHRRRSERRNGFFTGLKSR